LFLSGFRCSRKEAAGCKVKYINLYNSRNFDQLELGKSSSAATNKIKKKCLVLFSYMSFAIFIQKNMQIKSTLKSIGSQVNFTDSLINLRKKKL
jgi:hypothetical protein